MLYVQIKDFWNLELLGTMTPFRTSDLRWYLINLLLSPYISFEISIVKNNTKFIELEEKHTNILETYQHGSLHAF